MDNLVSTRHAITHSIITASLAIIASQTLMAAETKLPAVQINTKQTPARSQPDLNQHAKKESVNVVAAQVVWVKGTVNALGADKKARPLQRKDFVYEHDVITVDKNASGQIIFSDGTLVALSEGSVFKVDQYRFISAKPKQQRYVVDVVKGGFRTVTGIISKAGPNEYKINTPVATIGVRGTEIVGVIKADGTSSFSVPKGAADFTNQSGKYTLDSAHPNASFKSSTAAPSFTALPAPGLSSVPPVDSVKPSAELTQKSEATSALAISQNTSSGGDATSGTSGESESDETIGASSSDNGSGDSTSSSGSSSGSDSNNSDTTQGITNDFTICP